MGKPRKYTPEFLRSLLAWQGDTCAMPGCRGKKMLLDNYYKHWKPNNWDEKTQWNVCRCCQYTLQEIFRTQRKAYSKVRWELERPRDLKCFYCNAYGERVYKPSWYMNVARHIPIERRSEKGIRACLEHKADAMEDVLNIPPREIEAQLNAKKKELSNLKRLRDEHFVASGRRYSFTYFWDMRACIQAILEIEEWLINYEIAREKRHGSESKKIGRKLQRRAA